MFTQEYVSDLVTKSIENAKKAIENQNYNIAEKILELVCNKFEQNRPDIMQLLGLAYHAQEKYERGVEIFEHVLQIQPTNAENFNNLGLCYGSMGKHEKAIELIKKAISLDTKNYLFFNNLGHQYRFIRKYEEAILAFKMALKLNECDLVYYNIGGCYLENLEHEDAIYYLSKCTSDAAKVALGYAYQLRGEWDKAWELYESRMDYFKQAAFFKKYYDYKKKWNGEILDGKTLVVYCEQGIGDLIQFSRFVDKIKGHVIIDCPEELHSLLTINGYNVTSKGHLTNHDYHCSIMSLPFILKISDFEKQSVVKTFQSKKADINYKEFKIGIAWGGSPQHTQDRDRSTYLKYFKLLHDIPGVKLFSFQKDLRTRIWPPSKEPVDLMENTDQMSIVDMSPYMNTFEDTAGILKEMDLVVTVDTALLHLAGVMGVPTLGLLAYEADTRWGFGSDTFWYPHLVLLRQESRGDWRGVFRKAYDEINRVKTQRHRE